MRSIRAAWPGSLPLLLCRMQETGSQGFSATQCEPTYDHLTKAERKRKEELDRRVRAMLALLSVAVLSAAVLPPRFHLFGGTAAGRESNRGEGRETFLRPNQGKPRRTAVRRCLCAAMPVRDHEFAGVQRVPASDHRAQRHGKSRLVAERLTTKQPALIGRDARTWHAAPPSKRGLPKTVQPEAQGAEALSATIDRTRPVVPVWLEHSAFRQKSQREGTGEDPEAQGDSALVRLIALRRMHPTAAAHRSIGDTG